MGTIFKFIICKIGRWNHIAVSYDGQKLRFYLNGVQDSNVVTVGLTFGKVSESLVIGADFPGGDEYFDGQIKEVRLWKTARSIEADWRAGLQ